MQKLAEICIRRPVFAAMIVLSLVVVGSASYFKLGVDRFPSVDLPTMMARKDQVVKQLTGGVGYLFKKNKVDSIMGSGRIVAPDTVEVKSAQGTQVLKTARILIATGSVPITGHFSPVVSFSIGNGWTPHIQFQP